jgi:hypothetical protein
MGMHHKHGARAETKVIQVVITGSFSQTDADMDRADWAVCF